MASHGLADAYLCAHEAGVPHRRIQRLIEADLPIGRISAHAANEKSIRHGHISTLHIWWARRPLAACRAVICAALWPDPADPLCPPAFRDAAAVALAKFARRMFPHRINEESMQLQETVSPDSRRTWESIIDKEVSSDAGDDEPEEASRFAQYVQSEALRDALLDFIADFANWDNSTVPAYLETSRALTQAAHEALGGAAGARPIVVDPFAGGGSIPLEALRVGADAFASDLNPVAVLLNKVIQQYIPRYGVDLAAAVRKWGKSVKEHAEQKLAPYYPSTGEAGVPVAYIWARTIRCDGPGCGATIPLIRSLWISKQGRRSIAIRLIPVASEKRVSIEIVDNANAKDVSPGTIRRGSVTCPCCGYTTPVRRVREQLREQSGGADTSQLLVVVSRGTEGKSYRTPLQIDHDAVRRSQSQVNRAELLPPVELPLMSGVFNAPLYGITRWDLLFSSRQLLAASALGDAVRFACTQISKDNSDAEFALAVKVLLLLARGKYLDFRTTLCAWISVGEKIGHTFGRQALGMIFDWVEGVPFGDMSGCWERCVDYLAEFVERESGALLHPGIAERADAQALILPDDSISAIVTDPPYYNAVPYADLSDFFYIWLNKDLKNDFPALFASDTVAKEKEICEMKGWDPVRYAEKDAAFYESGMEEALREARRICVADGVGIVVFAHKTTAGWETLLSALIKAGWTVTGSWPIDTERGGRLRAMNSAALASSVHLVCRPRDAANGRESVGEWRDILRELPTRIRKWMPRLAAEEVVGADAIFACLGPALEIFSRYSRVEKSNGEEAMLGEYLEHVWAAVSTEALSLIFKDADTAGLEPDARLTAMWLWTIGGAATGNGRKAPSPRQSPLRGEGATEDDSEDETAADDEESTDSAGKTKAAAVFTLEFDAARKISQGLGVNLEQSDSLVEIKGDKARLLSVAERTAHLFGKSTVAGRSAGRRRAKAKQKTFFVELDEAEAAEAGWSEFKGPTAGSTVLDRVHQAMILFGAGRGELLKRFLVEDGVGRDNRFWKLADNLNKLYPRGTDERRWIEGVLARKKGLGL